MSRVPLEVLQDPALMEARRRLKGRVQPFPKYHGEPDAEGFVSYGCRRCGAPLHELKINVDGETLRLECPECRRSVTFKIRAETTVEAVPPYRRECPECRGEGIIPLNEDIYRKCHKCGGSGFVTV